MMKYTIPVLALVISAVLSGCAPPPFHEGNPAGRREKRRYRHTAAQT